jgi:hypothetical protein
VLSDPDVQKAIANFLDEARICIQTSNQRCGRLGFPATLALCACMLAVGEALAGAPPPGQKHTDKDLFDTFCKEMPQGFSWLVPPAGSAGTVDGNTAAGHLCNIRNGLSHALAMPLDALLLAARADVASKDACKWGVILTDLLDAVQNAVASITQKHPGRTWDPTGTGGRGPAQVIPLEPGSAAAPSGTGSSAASGAI